MPCGAAKTPTAQGTVPPKGCRATVEKTALRNKNPDKENTIDSIKGGKGKSSTRKHSKQETQNKMARKSPGISTISIKVNRLNYANKIFNKQMRFFFSS